MVMCLFFSLQAFFPDLCVFLNVFYVGLGCAYVKSHSDFTQLSNIISGKTVEISVEQSCYNSTGFVEAGNMLDDDLNRSDISIFYFNSTLIFRSAINVRWVMMHFFSLVFYSIFMCHLLIWMGSAAALITVVSLHYNLQLISLVVFLDLLLAFIAPIRWRVRVH